MTHPAYDFANILFAGPCNQRCPTCIGRQIAPALNRDNLDAFPPRNLEPFAALLERHGVRQVVVSGTNTDPQLYRHEARLIRWLRARLPGAQIALHTNGQLALFKMDVLNTYNRATISFPSFDPATFARMTGTVHMPQLATIVHAARIPIKVSCLVNADNAGQVESFMARCHQIGVRRLVFRRPFGATGGPILPGRTPARTYRGNPVYDVHGMEVTCWDFARSSSTSLNLFSDGTISDRYLLAQAKPGSPPTA
jgi:pyruvate-formate lyase-activating enzyme